MKFVKTLKEFQQNFAIRFSSPEWLDAINFSKFIIVGGCVVNALCDTPFPDTKQQDINLFYLAYDGTNCEADMKDTIDQLEKMCSKYSKHKIKVERLPGTLDCTVFLPCGIRLNFAVRYIYNSENSISHIIHNLDVDLSQVAYTGTFVHFDCIIKTIFFQI